MIRDDNNDADDAYEDQLGRLAAGVALDQTFGGGAMRLYIIAVHMMMI